MKTAHLSRSAVSGRYKDFEYKFGKEDWLISICDLNWFKADVGFDFEKICYLDFYDTIVEQDGLTDEDAKKMADFIKEARALKKNLWVNCHMGVSRSGAVVEILMRLGWEVDEAMCSAQRIPNVLVFNKIAKHFPEISDNFKSNIICNV